MTAKNLPPCPSCAARKAKDGKIVKEELEAYIKNFVYVPGFSADEELYKERLVICTGCSALLGGILCGYSGQYAAYRARLLSATCPFPQGDKWKDL